MNASFYKISTATVRAVSINRRIATRLLFLAFFLQLEWRICTLVQTSVLRLDVVKLFTGLPWGRLSLFNLFLSYFRVRIFSSYHDLLPHLFFLVLTIRLDISNIVHLDMLFEVSPPNAVIRKISIEVPCNIKVRFQTLSCLSHLKRHILVPAVLPLRW